MRKSVFGIVLCVIFVLSAVAHAEKTTVTIKNIQKPNGVYFTPMLVTTHNGSFAPFMLHASKRQSRQYLNYEAVAFELLAAGSLTLNGACYECS